MQDILLTDMINTTGRFFDTSFELAVEQDILLADYDKAVFKTVKTNVDHTITQKYINGSKLIIEGFFRISVYYQPPQGAEITVISKKQPFQKQFDMQQTVSAPYFITVNGETQYINTRAVNSSRIAINGIYTFTVRAYTTQQLPVITAINSISVCTDSGETSGFALCGRGTRQFTMEEEISLPSDMDKILNISIRCNNMTVLVYRDKVNIKGDAVAQLSYTIADSADVKQLNRTYAFNQITDINGISENNIAYADFLPVTFTVTQNPDTKKINGILVAQLDVKVFHRESLFTVSDAFSKTCEYSSENKNIIYDANIRSVNKRTTLSIEDAVGSGYTPVHHLINISSPVLSTDRDKNILKAKRTVSAIVKNDRNEYECFNKSRDISIDTGTELSRYDEVFITCHPYDSTLTVAGDILRADINLNISGFIIKRKEISLLSDFTEDTDQPFVQPSDALILYYGQKGERVFDIAMRYKTDVSVINKENSLESEKLQEDKMLFIPVFGM